MVETTNYIKRDYPMTTNDPMAKKVMRSIANELLSMELCSSSSIEIDDEGSMIIPRHDIHTLPGVGAAWKMNDEQSRMETQIIVAGQNMILVHDLTGIKKAIHEAGGSTGIGEQFAASYLHLTDQIRNL